MQKNSGDQKVWRGFSFLLRVRRSCNSIRLIHRARMEERDQRVWRADFPLRAPSGCPWNREQTHESLKPMLLEEAYEVIEAIDTPMTKSLWQLAT